VSQGTNLPLHPDKHSHVVQFYSDNDWVVRAAGKELGDALLTGSSADDIVTIEFSEKIDETL